MPFSRDLGLAPEASGSTRLPSRLRRYNLLMGDRSGRPIVCEPPTLRAPEFLKKLKGDGAFPMSGPVNRATGERNSPCSSLGATIAHRASLLRWEPVGHDCHDSVRSEDGDTRASKKKKKRALTD
jgi:hypothetical protein